MKIEMGESLFYSWLRHVKEFQIVQISCNLVVLMYIDSKNKTGLCPKCEKAAGDGAVVVGLAGLILLAKNGQKLLRALAISLKV